MTRLTGVAGAAAVAALTVALTPAMTALPAAAAETMTINGAVTDASGQGWPMWAQVGVDGGPSTHTDPWTGRYTLELPAGQEHTVRVRSEYPGYPDVAVTVGAGGAVDVGMRVDAGSCVAPGYAHRSTGLVEAFDAGSPAGWTVVDHLGEGQAWHFDDPGQRGNLTGAREGFAIAESGLYGYVSRQDAELISPVVDLTGVTAPEIGFNSDLFVYEYDEPGGIADVDLSLDGGATWSTVWREIRQVRGPQQVVVSIPQAAGEPDARFRFRYHEGIYTASEWWQVDNVYLGNRTCDPRPGGLLAGRVTDRNTGDPVATATVASTQDPDVSTRSLADGHYWMFVPHAGEHPFAARQRRYQPFETTGTIATGRTARADFSLPAGRISVQGEVRADLDFGERATVRVTVRNTGYAAATVRLAERPGGHDMLTAQGPPAAAAERLIDGQFLPTRGGGAGPDQGAASVTTGGPWSSLPDLPIEVADNSAAEHGGLIYSVGGRSGQSASITAGYAYDPATSTWRRIADLPSGRQKPIAAFLGGKLHVAGGWGPEWNAPIVPGMDVYDPATDTWAAGPELPDPAAGAGTAVLDDQLYVVGGCIGDSVCGTSTVSRFDLATQRWERVADYPEPVAWVGCGAVEDILYCAGGSAGRSTRATYAYDPGADTWTRRADLPIDLWAMGYTVAGGRLLVSGGVTNGTRTLTNQGFGYDPLTDTWSALPNSTHSLYRGGSACGFFKVGGANGGLGGTPFAEALPGLADCAAFRDSDWLSTGPTTPFTLAPGATVQVELRLDARRLTQPGSYTSAVLLRTDTPYGLGEIDVTMNVDPPRSWGLLTGTVTGTSCDGTDGPVAGATVWINARSGQHTVTTDADGGYARWLDAQPRTVEVIAGGGDWLPTATQVRLHAGAQAVQDFGLVAASCG